MQGELQVNEKKAACGRGRDKHGQPAAPIEAVTRLAVALRLEEEALAPEKVELIVQQVVYSEERKARFPDNSEVLEMERILLQPYTPRDINTQAVVLPYPMCAPAQSALGITSFDEVRKWKNEVRRVEGDNAVNNWKYQWRRAEVDTVLSAAPLASADFNWPT